MVRRYYREDDVEYGRPRTRIAKRPPDFSLCDTSGWDARRYLRELADRQSKHEWQQQKEEWKRDEREWKQRDEWRREREDTPWDNLIPVNDPDETNRLLARPPAVSQITSQERAAHALRLGMILIAVDPNTPDLVKRLGAEAKDIRAKHPLPIKARGRPSASADFAGIDDQKVEQWRDHRIFDLYDLIIKEHDPDKERMQLAWWLFQDDFPNVKDRRARAKKLDRAVELLNEALASTRMIDAQTRKGPQRREGLMDYVAGVIEKQLDALAETMRLSTTRKITVVPVVIKDAVPTVIKNEKVPLRSRT